ncbi:histidinol-phosphatase HisJ family protein [Bacillus sp. 1P06AnD]|uniref:histidinol-phosphatase HisJ family protein n=1 Tax=Bacillus sp. 1P06AnD TaxID=3132208 RepID=UPI00399F8F9B
MDYHHHSNHSFDSKAEMKDICAAAIEKGIQELCFTEHFSVNPLTPTYGHMNFESYFQDLQNCRELFGEQLTIKTGIELCEPHLMKQEYDQALQSLSFDFIMGSIHNIQQKKLSAIINEYGDKANDLYFEEVYKLVSTADIDVLAHIDLIKRYTYRDKGTVYSFEQYKGIIEKILRKAIERGIGIEINTSGLRTSLNAAMPSKEIVQLYKELGGKILTIGSDSHSSKDVGGKVLDGYEIAKECGFTELTVFTGRKPEQIHL